ncbi:MAG: hypothetical protein GKR87_05615 [Kiritimatiellae bacterium]|nr:hypothetical protein [Kiritimatiellia bacterium]
MINASDVEGTPRIINDFVDIGAYEYVYEVNDTSTQANAYQQLQTHTLLDLFEPYFRVTGKIQDPWVGNSTENVSLSWQDTSGHSMFTNQPMIRYVYPRLPAFINGHTFPVY